MIARQIGEALPMGTARRQVCWTVKVALWVVALLVFAVANAEAAPIVVDHNATPCITPSVHFTTIQAAVNAAPSGATIHVCPGNYPEQVTISLTLTLDGISAGSGVNPVITSPPTGVVANATSAGGDSIAAQVFVNSVGSVDISGIAVDGSNSQVAGGCAPVLVGIYYQNTSGEVSHVSVRNQSGNGCAYPIFVETTGSASQAVTIDKSSIHDFDNGGVVACSGAAGCFGSPVSGATSPTVTLTSNTIADVGPPSFGIYLFGAAASVTDNFLSGFGDAIIVRETSTASLSNNSIGESLYAISVTGNAGIQVTSNKLFRNTTAGIIMAGASNTTVRGNVITNSPGTGVGIEFGCSGTNNNVISNAFDNVGTGLHSVPAGNTTTPNNYFNVTTKQTGGC
jgi:parallel beta-helix repeat protein